MYQHIVTITKTDGTWPDYFKDLSLTFFENAINPSVTEVLIANLYTNTGAVYPYPTSLIYAQITDINTDIFTWTRGLVGFTLHISGLDYFTKMDLLVKVSFDNKNNEVYTDQEYGFPYIYEDCSSTLLNNYFYNNKKCIEYTPYSINADPWAEKNEARITNFGVANDFTFNTYKPGTKPSFKNKFYSLLPQPNYSSTQYRIYKLTRELIGLDDINTKPTEVLRLYRSTIDTSSGVQTNWTLIRNFYSYQFKDKVIPKRIIVVIQGGGSSGRNRSSNNVSYWAAGGGSGATIVAILDTSVDWLLRPGYGGRAGATTVGDGWDSFVKTTDEADIFIAGGGIVAGKTRGQKGTASSTINGHHGFILGSQSGANGGFGWRGDNQYPAGDGGSCSIRAYATYNTAEKFGYNELFETQPGGSKGPEGEAGISYSGGGGSSPFGQGGAGVYFGQIGIPGTLGSGGGGALRSTDGASTDLAPGDGGDGFIWLYY